MPTSSPDFPVQRVCWTSPRFNEKMLIINDVRSYLGFNLPSLLVVPHWYLCPNPNGILRFLAAHEAGIAYMKSLRAAVGSRGATSDPYHNPAAL